MEAKRMQTPPNESETLGYITREQLEKFTRAMRRDEIEYITMELLVGSLFPNLYKNFKQRIADEHMRGYLDGLNERNKTEANNN